MEGELTGKTPGQCRYLQSVRSSKVTICTGPAGTGKTYMACGVAAQLLRAEMVKKIVLTRPLAECDEEVGILPGDLNEKVSGVMRPMLDALAEFFSQGEVERRLREGTIVLAPLAHMRGATFKDAFIILDEAQNATPRQLRMFLTRLGQGTKMVVCGDETQSDLPYAGKNALSDVVERFHPDCHKDVSIARLSKEDIVRHPLIQWMDERLTDGPPKAKKKAPSYGPELGRGVGVDCPHCDETGVLTKDLGLPGLLVMCCHCDKPIDVYDEDGWFDPVKAKGWHKTDLYLERLPA